nr:MAG TPA: hypothetical protein [Caudoviricetes sp.]
MLAQVKYNMSNISFDEIKRLLRSIIYAPSIWRSFFICYYKIINKVTPF